MTRQFICGLALLAFAFSSCKKEGTTTASQEHVEDTYNSGEVTVYVEESITPIFDDINTVFKATYSNASVHKVTASENRILRLMFEDSIQLAFIPRKLNAKEEAHFEGKVVPKQTPIAKDAILFITNKTSNDSLIKYEDIVQVLKNKDKKSNQVIVFDNINSSLVNTFKKDAGITQPGNNVYFLPSTARVVDYISKNKNAIGVVGINWLLQPDDSLAATTKNIKSLAVYNSADGRYYKASQSTIADGTYPLVRELYMIDLQGKHGLGKGYASFAASDIGQRIVLKSGLMPINTPPRQMTINGGKQTAP